MDIFAAFVAPAVLGIFVGACSGMLGIGGGTILVPVFRLVFGMDPLVATGTSLFTIVPTSLSGAISHIRMKTAVIPVGLILGIGGACTSPIGVWLASVSPTWTVMLVAALVIGYSAINMLLKAARMKSSPKSDTTKGGASAPVTPRFTLTRKAVLVSLATGLGAGVLSGYVGVGGGFIMVPLMVAFLGVTMKQASGTSLVAMIILAIPGVITQGSLGHVDYLFGLIVAVGSIPGAMLGAWVLRFISERVLRFTFGGFLIIAAVLLAINETHVFG